MYWRTSYIIINIARPRIAVGPFLPYFGMLLHPGSHTAAEFDFGQPRILDLYQDISIKGYTSNL